MKEEIKKKFNEQVEQAIEETKKESLYDWLKSIILGFWAIVTIITCCGVWNSDAAGFVKAMTTVLFAINAAAIAIVAVKYHPYKKAK